MVLLFGPPDPLLLAPNQAGGVPGSPGTPDAAAPSPLEVLMRSPSVLSAAALCLASACSDSIPVEPTTAALSAFSARASAKAASSSSDELVAIDSRLAGLAERVGMALPLSTMILGAQVLHSDALTYEQSAS